MSESDNIVKKRGRPRKNDVTMTRKEYDQQRYQQQKNIRSEEYQKEREEKRAYSKELQSKYRESYRILKQLCENGKIMTTPEELENIKKLID